MFNLENQCYILLVSKYGRKKDAFNHNLQSCYNASKDSKDNHEILAGTLLMLVDEKPDNIKHEYILETLDLEKTFIIKCEKKEIEEIHEDIIDLIRPIPTCKERLEVYNDKNWIADGKHLKLKEQVFVKLKNDLSEYEGILRYKGSDITEWKGIYFGVQLVERKGNCDGSIKKKRFFKTEPDFAVFVPLHKIRKRREDWHKNTRKKADENGDAFLPQEYNLNCNLSVGERVVWISDDGPERGFVRWIGVLPGEAGDNITVGVEFDKPVGTGTGKYKDQRLFFTKHGHASLIPLMGLIKEEEFEPVGHYDMGTESAILVPGENLSRSTNSDNRTIRNIDLPMQVNISNSQSFAETGVNSNDIPLYKHRGMDSSGLNPVYEHSRLQEETSSSSKSSSSLGRNSNQEVDPDLMIGSMVEVQLKVPLYGVIRWIGELEGGKLTAGLELEEEQHFSSDGTFRGVRYFTCAPKKAFFIPLYKCSKDKRFLTHHRKQSTDFGIPETPDLTGDIPNPEIDKNNIGEICGKNKGIQGHHNSCYLDATLFSMFYFTTVFDNIFNRPTKDGDLPEYPKVQQVLKEGIVNPLRKYHYVRADKVLKLRALLDKLGTIQGMMGEEKDPEEFLSALLTQIMRADPLLHLSSGEHTYFYQLFMEKDEKLLIPTTQKLVELSFLQGNVKLKEVPSCLMIQMPRFGKDYKMFRRIVPSLQLDITDILENCPRHCIVCGSLARHECKDCYQVHGQGLNTTAFCDNCVKTSHQHVNRRNHKPTAISTADFEQYYEQMKKELSEGQKGSDDTIVLRREIMELFAVICIQTSHYVTFVKCGSGKRAPWVFFDSMADRMGEQGGYNIPEVTHIPELSKWLDESNVQELYRIGDDKELPEHLRRILCDGYMCMYQSTEVMMFN
ncbi:ubiquitin carboxyl-terminal hydrolase CYLD [Biomphalaria glabrata]|uniref:ubiquitinyl hydrolase 1 n=1 Tax=Biomphalaria glabrata TaxID=6526 RepID=A0A2C9K0B5_BIOGL|nr:ubiquitin carboxyl-terminal hydrolase CYLD-like [Biomphalaria glabrata]KAI8790460.1 ubiquitin carboxyl-terminal hydrolase CYLD [Biomphalaria glabrata]